MSETAPITETSSTTAAHLAAARKRGRRLMAEGGAGLSYEWLHASSAARDGVILILSLFMVLQGAAERGHAAILIAAAVVLALYTGVANMLAVTAQLRAWEAELRRERDEIRHQPEQEREEVRALYEAKGFSGPMLEQIVDTLCADEERLLKVMLEEELGIFVEQSPHPVWIGLVTAVAAMIGGLIVAATAALAPLWATAVAVAAVLFAVCVFQNRGLNRPAIESFARWAITAGTIGGVAFFLGNLLKG
jgi:VIT1/CCC1 family predicted Fe2+/Mn2+ transporter